MITTQQDVLRALRVIQFATLLTIATWLSLTPDPGSAFANVWDKLLHSGSWLILMLSLKLAMHPSRHLILPALVLFAYSCGIEVVQFFVPERQLSFADMGANAIGIGLGCMLVACRAYFSHALRI